MIDIKNKEIVRDFKEYHLSYFWGLYKEGNGYNYGYRTGYKLKIGYLYGNGLGHCFGEYRGFGTGYGNGKDGNGKSKIK